MGYVCLEFRAENLNVELVSKLLNLLKGRLDEVTKGKDRALRSPEVLQLLEIGERRGNG